MSLLAGEAICNLRRMDEDCHQALRDLHRAKVTRQRANGSIVTCQSDLATGPVSSLPVPATSDALDIATNIQPDLATDPARTQRKSSKGNDMNVASTTFANTDSSLETSSN